MAFKIKHLLLKFDFIGFVPQFRILDETRYKSIFSSILSIILILFSIAFVSYSFSEFIHQNPKVEYYKSNDDLTNKTFLISDSLLMFKYDFYSWPNVSNKPTFEITIYNIKEDFYQSLDFEPCELGKNIDIKYKETIEKFEKIEKMNVSDFFCINFNNTKFMLYSHPSLPSEYENILNIRVYSDCEDYMLYFKLVTENDFIDHNKKDNPIVPYYKNTDIFLYNEYKYLYYYFHYIKFESDEGFIFSNKKTLNGIGVSSSTSSEGYGKPYILCIDFKMNSANYDFYRRKYEKFQSFVADVSSLINLLITISQVISEFLLSKKMNKDIIRYILTTNNKMKKNISEKQTSFNRSKLNEILENDNKSKSLSSEKKVMDINILENQKSKNPLDSNNNENNFEKGIDDKKIIYVMKKLKFINILKSFFCWKEKKLKLIELCDNIIKKEICIEKILKRLYILESIFNIIIEENRELYINNDISQIKEIIDSIYNELIYRK